MNHTTLQLLKSAVLIVGPFLFPATLCFSASIENLDEAISRKPRLSTSSFSRAVFEGASPTYYWQPETLQYSDILTGSEVWRLTYTPSGQNYTQDISSTHWSANGNRVLFGTYRPTTALTAGGSNDQTWMTVKTDGSRLRTAADLSNNWNNWSIYPAWNPSLADVLYLPGTGSNANNATLYKNTVSDGSVSKTSVVTVDSSSSRRLIMKKSIAPDGSKIFMFDRNDTAKTAAWSVNLKTNTLETPTTGYSTRFNWDPYWGVAPSSWTFWHDQYLSGAVNGAYGLWFYHMPENTSGTWWRSRLTGTGLNNAPNHIQDHTASDGYSWGGELEPVNTVTSANNKIDPWGKVSYVSHFTPDRWGHYGIFSESTGTKTGSKYGASLINLDTHSYWNAAYVFSGANVPWVQHHDWEAWSDWSVSSGSPQLGEDYRLYRVTTQNYKDPTSQRLVALTHNFENSSGKYSLNPVYNAYTRPTQSPDGTKIMFNSTFLNASDNDVQLFWTVAYYPYPPEIKSVSKVSGNVRLVWDFNQGSSCSSSSGTTQRTGPAPNFSTPRTYATRGWPNETLDCPPSPREVDKFRVWVSSDSSTWTPVATTAYNNCRGANECGMWSETAWTYDAVQANNTIRYYAVTSVEYSGLESRTLSNVWKVALDANGNISSQSQQAAYPANPGGKSVFYTINPLGPANAGFAHQLSPATTAGQYTITWSAPSEKTLIRYYNIYAADGAAPIAVQQQRIASIPATADYDGAGNYRYIDWLGNPDGSTKYLVTSVDFQGNESPAVGVLKSPTGLKVTPIAQ